MMNEDDPEQIERLCEALEGLVSTARASGGEWCSRVKLRQSRICLDVPRATCLPCEMLRNAEVALAAAEPYRKPPKGERR